METQTTEVAVIIAPELSKVISENTSIEVPVAQSFARAFAPNMETVTSLSKALLTMNRENPSANEAKQQISREDARQKEIISAQIDRFNNALKFLLSNNFKESSNGVTHSKYLYFINENRFNSFDSDEQLQEFKTEILNSNIRDDKAKEVELENTRLAKELQAKKDADIKAENEKKALELAEEKCKKALAKAGDKVRINTWISNFELPEFDTKGMSEESILKSKDIVAKFELFKAWSKTQTENI